MKLKKCSGCGNDRPIWKNVTEEGIRKKFCRQCWGARAPQPSIKKRVEISPRSEKRSKEERSYAARRILFLKDNPMCQAALPSCNKFANQVHHKKGRIGDLLIDTQYWLAVCYTCHVWIELNPNEAKELGFSLNRLND
jgi:hypothetical protein